MNMPVVANPASRASRHPVLLPSQLLPGDIIVTASPTFNSRTIQWTTNETVSHALLHWRSGWAVEAVPGKGVSHGLLQRLLQDATSAAVVRHRYATPTQCSAAAQWAAAQSGKPYDTVGAMRLGLQPGARTAAIRFSPHGFYVKVIHDTAARLSEAGHDASFFCSELIAKAYVEVGAPLTDHPAYLTTPGRLLTSSVLRYIGEVRGIA